MQSIFHCPYCLVPLQQYTQDEVEHWECPNCSYSEELDLATLNQHLEV